MQGWVQVPERDLWAAVVSQAADDINTKNYQSIEYDQAVSFFTASGEWATSRQGIADFMELHVNDIERLGRTTIAVRHACDGPPPAGRLRLEQPATGTVPVPCSALPVAETRHLLVPPLEPASSRNTESELSRKCRPARDRDWWVAKFMAKQEA
jgi:hypothetical protein